jgi:hypothetical protein
MPAVEPVTDLNPVEGLWAVLKRGVLANLAVARFGHLVQVIRHGLKKIQYQPGLIEGCLAGTKLTVNQMKHQRTSRIKVRGLGRRLGSAGRTAHRGGHR